MFRACSTEGIGKHSPAGKQNKRACGREILTAFCFLHPLGEMAALHGVKSAGSSGSISRTRTRPTLSSSPNKFRRIKSKEKKKLIRGSINRDFADDILCGTCISVVGSAEHLLNPKLAARSSLIVSLIAP